MRWHAWWLALFVTNSAVAPASAQTAADPKPDIVFDHSEGKSRIYQIDLNDGQRLVIHITKTCPGSYDYSFVPHERGVIPETAELPPLTTQKIDRVHEKQYGGYTIRIDKKPADVATRCKGDEKLMPLSFIVSVRQREWNVSFSGGFTISGLTDPVFSLQQDGTSKKVVLEPGKQDDRKLGLASFVHVFHDGVGWKQLQPALAFGLGLNGDSHAEYLIGGALRLGDKATVNIGGAWGSIARLPNGVKLDAPVTDDNVLANLGRRVVSRWFFGLSYAFIDTKDRLLKPFAEDNSGGGAGGEGEKKSTAAAPMAAATQEIVTDLAADAATYQKVAALQKLLASKTVTTCGATVTPVSKTEATVVVHLKDASESQLKEVAAAGADAQSALNTQLAEKGLGKVVTIAKPVTFDAKCP